MSLTTDARTYADAALGQGRAALADAQQRVSGAAEDLRAQADTAAGRLAASVNTLTETARTQALAVLGAGDVARSAVAERVERIPAAARDLRARSEQAAGNLTSAGADPSATLDSVRDGAQKQFDAYLGLARAVYTGLAERGEKVVEDLRHDPRLLRVLGGADDAVRATADRVADAAGDVRTQAREVSRDAAADKRSVSATKAAGTRRATAEKRSAAGRKAAATRAAKTTTRSTSASTSTAGTSSARKSTARKSTARKSTR